MNKIMAVLGSIVLAIGLGVAPHASQAVSKEATVQQIDIVPAGTEFCQTCKWVWSIKFQRYVQSCTLVVCHAV